MTAGMLTRWALPTGPDVEVHEAGVHWDVVCVPSTVGARVLAALGEDSGGAFRDCRGHLCYWLVSCGAADCWLLPDEAHLRILGRGSWVGVPPAENRHASAQWERLIDGDLLTDASHMHAALQVAITEAVRL